MPQWLIIFLIVVAVVLVILAVLALVGSRMQKKSDAAQASAREAAQTVSILVIDKKRMKFKEAGFQKAVIDQTPKYLRGMKVCVVKAKIGPKVVSLICDDKIFNLVPVKKEVKASISGMYIIDVKGVRGPLEVKQEKKSLRDRIFAKKAKLEAEVKSTKKK